MPPLAAAPCSAHLPSLGKSLGHFTVATTIAGGDEISNPTALQEGGRGDGALAEDLGKANHLHQPQTDNGSLCIVSKAKTIAETSPYSHNVLENNSTERCVPSKAQGTAVSTGASVIPSTDCCLPLPVWSPPPSKQLSRTCTELPKKPDLLLSCLCKLECNIQRSLSAPCRAQALQSTVSSSPTFKAPQISTVSASCTTVTRKFGVCISSFRICPYCAFLQPNEMMREKGQDDGADPKGELHSNPPTWSCCIQHSERNPLPK